MSETLRKYIEGNFSFRPNHNQLRDLERLIFEIGRRENTSLEALTSYLKSDASVYKHSGRNKFFALKNVLVNRRFPLTSAKEKIDTKKVFLNALKPPLSSSFKVTKDFLPELVYVEKEVKNSYLVNNFKKFYPGIEIEELNRYSEYLKIKKNKFKLSHLKKPIVFIIKENWDFLKPCPCTKYHLSCGYWILNLGFGCPHDCSYCFLQCYTNSPGILLPANIDDFFEKFDFFSKKLKKPIRIGTGEFSDSLALDEVTEYSRKLIPYFKNKNVFFELKTKSDSIDNLLNQDTPKNAVISWSLNPALLIETEELGTASLKDRLQAALTLQKKGYKIAFHFDPIIAVNNWQHLYKGVIDTLYRSLIPPFAWISLGTLRSNRSLKRIVEQRFPESEIFYGELFLGEDKKLRYPQFLRYEIYSKMIKWIRSYDSTTPVYLCMEDLPTWRVLGNEFRSALSVEKYLLGISP